MKVSDRTKIESTYGKHTDTEQQAQNNTLKITGNEN